MASRNEPKVAVEVPRGFRRGMSQLNPFRVAEFRLKMMDAMGWKARTTFSQYMNGNKTPLTTQAAAIEQVFAEFGVTKDIWGDEL